MVEEKETQKQEVSADKPKIHVKRVVKRKDNSKSKKKSYDSEFDKRIISIRRVTRMYEGGKRLRLSVCIVVGDKKGRVGIGIGKGADVRAAEEKAYNYAVKHLVQIPLKGTTIPHESYHKKGAAKIVMKPAAPGTGIVAGSSIRAVFEVVGIKDILSKILGTNNQINNAYAAFEALSLLRPPVITNSVKSNS